MSIKIYEGFRFTKQFSLQQLHKIFMDFRVEAERLRLRGLLDYFSRECCELLDEKSVGLAHPTDPIFSTVWRRYSEDLKELEQKHLRQPEIDFSFELSVHPLRDKLIGIVFSEHNLIYEAWFAKPFVKEYGYWNNCDCPEGVTKREWHQRQRDWDRALGDNSVPALNGICATISVNRRSKIEFDALKFPPFKKRVVVVAEKLALAQKSRGRKFELMSEYSRFEREQRQFWETSAGRKYFEKLKLRAEKKLIRKIVEKHLLTQR